MGRQTMQRLALGGAIGVVLVVASGSAAAPPSQPVHVTNTPLPVTVATTGAPVNAFSRVSSPANQVDNTVFTIPVGKRLVIEYISARATVPSGQRVSAIHLNIPVVHFLVVAAQGTDLGGDNVFTAAQSLRITVGPFGVPMGVVVRTDRNAFGISATLDVTLAGQLID
jgi:hypothetical protein